jgi:hypothetical protein
VKLSIVFGMISLALSFFVAYKSSIAIKVVRVVSGMMSAMGIIIFFNPFLLGDFGLLSRIPFVMLLFIIYEIIFLSYFFICEKLIKMTDE